jgi:hypothetical protein
MPIFFSHFIEHSKGGSLISELKEFVIHHYGGHEMDEDWETDQKLPFMNIEFHHVDFYFSPIKTFQFNVKRKPITTSKTPITTQEHWHSKYLDSIWQPPKIA